MIDLIFMEKYLFCLLVNMHIRLYSHLTDFICSASWDWDGILLVWFASCNSAIGKNLFAESLEM